jgi:hypothetical protein
LLDRTRIRSSRNLNRAHPRLSIISVDFHYVITIAESDVGGASIGWHVIDT